METLDPVTKAARRDRYVAKQTAHLLDLDDTPENWRIYRDAVANARREFDFGSTIDEIADEGVRDLSRRCGGVYCLLEAALAYAEEEGALGGTAGLGTASQDRILLAAARLAVRNPNGCRERLAFLLDAVAQVERNGGGLYSPRLARQTYGNDGLVAVADEPSRALWRDRDVETASRLARGEGRQT